MPASSVAPPMIVIDAGVAAAAVLDMGLSEETSRAWDRWRASGVQVFAPLLWLYEVTTAIRKALAIGGLEPDEAEASQTAALSMNVTLVPPDDELCRAALRFAEQLGQTAAYDGFYLAPTSRLPADFWTTDQRLVNAARQAGIRRAHWVGELETKTD